MSETYRDKCGHTISRKEALQEAVDIIMQQGDARSIVRDHVEHLSDDELMEWIVYPDTGEFSDFRHRPSTLAVR